MILFSQKQTLMPYSLLFQQEIQAPFYTIPEHQHRWKYGCIQRQDPPIYGNICQKNIMRDGASNYGAFEITVQGTPTPLRCTKESQMIQLKKSQKVWHRALWPGQLRTSWSRLPPWFRWLFHITKACFWLVLSPYICYSNCKIKQKGPASTWNKSKAKKKKSLSGARAISFAKTTKRCRSYWHLIQLLVFSLQQTQKIKQKHYQSV